jgi:hypothetical protein
MLMKKAKKTKAPEQTEFTDADGKKWIQTSTADLFSIRELNEILESVEKEKDQGEIVLASINFKKVNREYYDTVNELKGKLDRRTVLLKKLIIESRDTTERKNRKLKELIEYIKKLHTLLAYYKLSPEAAEKLHFAPEPAPRHPADIDEEEMKIIEYSPVEEVLLDDEGNEIKK